jgi:hypothetical protein
VEEFGYTVDYAMLVKEYSNADVKEERTYSPAKIVAAKKTAIWGRPDESRICTSYIERSNLSIRMGVRRMTRLTNALLQLLPRSSDVEDDPGGCGGAGGQNVGGSRTAGKTRRVDQYGRTRQTYC